MTSEALVSGKSLVHLVPKTESHSSGVFPLHDGGELRYLILPYETDHYAIFTRYEREYTQSYVASKTQFDAVAAERSPLGEGEFLQAFAATPAPSAFRTRTTPADDGKKTAQKELQGHKPEEENALQTKEEAALTFVDGPIIKQIQEIFRTNAWAQFLEQKGVSALVHEVKLPTGRLLTHTTYMGAGDTLVPEVTIFDDDRIIICSRKVEAKIDKDFMRENVARSTKISAGIGLSMGGTNAGIQPMEGDPAFSRGKQLTAGTGGPGISFSGEMVKTYHRLTIKASLRMVVNVSDYTITVLPRKAP
jgi:hypothetical protein